MSSKQNDAVYSQILPEFKSLVETQKELYDGIVRAQQNKGENQENLEKLKSEYIAMKQAIISSAKHAQHKLGRKYDVYDLVLKSIAAMEETGDEPVIFSRKMTRNAKTQDRISNNVMPALKAGFLLAIPTGVIGYAISKSSTGFFIGIILSITLWGLLGALGFVNRT